MLLLGQTVLAGALFLRGLSKSVKNSRYTIGNFLSIRWQPVIGLGASTFLQNLGKMAYNVPGSYLELRLSFCARVYLHKTPIEDLAGKIKNFVLIFRGRFWHHLYSITNFAHVFVGAIIHFVSTADPLLFINCVLILLRLLQT